MFSYNEIKELAQLVSDNDLGEIEIKSANGDSIIIKGRKEKVVAAAPVAVSAPVAAPVVASASITKAEEPAPVESTGKAIKSPIVGTFYKAADPSAEPFVKVGDIVKAGDVICIIEAMKIMNEVKADFGGVVKDILVKDGDALEYDQPIMILE